MYIVGMGRSSAPPLNGNLIRQARKEKGMTQAQVAAACAERGQWVDQARISRIENGGVKWRLKCLPVIAEVLDLDEDDLFRDVA